MPGEPMASMAALEFHAIFNQWLPYLEEEQLLSEKITWT